MDSVRNDAGSKCQVKTCVSDGLSVFSWKASRVLQFMSCVWLLNLLSDAAWRIHRTQVNAWMSWKTERPFLSVELTKETGVSLRPVTPLTEGAWGGFFSACLNASVPQCRRRWFTIGRPSAWVPESRAVNSWQFSGCAAKCHFPPEMPHEGRSSMRLSL